GVFNVDQYSSLTIIKCPRHCAAGTACYHRAPSLNCFADNDAVGLGSGRVHPDIDLAAKFAEELGVRLGSAELYGQFGVLGFLSFPA
ncbi:MAG: hypothetical protein ABSB39_24190, partial [Candidatus Sulfotelmatobacter sp.]